MPTTLKNITEIQNRQCDVRPHEDTRQQQQIEVNSVLSSETENNKNTREKKRENRGRANNAFENSAIATPKHTLWSASG